MQHVDPVCAAAQTEGRAVASGMRSAPPCSTALWRRLSRRFASQPQNQTATFSNTGHQKAVTRSMCA